MSELRVVTQILEPQIFLSGEVVRVEVSVLHSGASRKWTIKNIDGVLIGQCRLNTLSISEHVNGNGALNGIESTSPTKLSKTDREFFSALDPQSRISWTRELKSSTEWPYTINPERRSTKFVLKARLPETLPPSYRGNIIRFAYKALVKVELDDSSVHVFRLPLRVLPSVSAYQGTDSSSTLASSFAGVMSSSFSDYLSVPEYSTNPFHVDFNCKIAYGDNTPIDGLLQDNHIHPALQDKLSQLQGSSLIGSLKKIKKRGNIKRTRTSSTSQSPCATFAEIVSSSSVASFLISSPNGVICRIGLFKTVARLGDALRGYLDFRSATVPSFALDLRAETCEYFDANFDHECTFAADLSFATTPIDVVALCRSKALKVPENSLQTTWYETRLTCSNVKFLPFTIPIPLTAPAEFVLASRYWNGVCRVRWCLRFEFVVSKARERRKSQTNSAESRVFSAFLQDAPTTKNADFTAPIDCDTQTFTWELPVCIIPNGPAAFLLSISSSSSHVFSRS